MKTPLARYGILLGLVTASWQNVYAISSLANNDPYPIYSAIYDPFLTTWRKQWMKGDPNNCFCCEHFAFAVSPFYQKASRGNTFGGRSAFLGDLTGPWNMLALLYGNLPAGASLAGTQLGFAKINIFSNFYETQSGAPNPNQIFSLTNPLTEAYILDDPTKAIGYFSMPWKYQKVGARMEISWQPCEDFGITVQAGVSEIRQTTTVYIDIAAAAGFSCPNPPLEGAVVPCPNEFCDPIPTLIPNATTAPFYNTCDDTTPTSSTCTTPYCQIEDELMSSPDVAKTIFEQIGLNYCNFEETSLEDVRFIAWWRHVYAVNEGRNNCIWPAFLIVPSVEFNVIAPAAKAWNRTKMLGKPFGNDGHTALGADAGLAIDFVETIEIAFKTGVEYFFSRNVNNYRIPTDVSQSGIFPFATSVKVQPGLNFNFNAIVSAYHFYYNFSAWVEYVMVKHEQDKISLLNPDPAFLVGLAECQTKFVSQLINGAVNYDISPNIALGIMFQFPIGQRNAYRSTTVLGTFRIVF